MRDNRGSRGRGDQRRGESAGPVPGKSTLSQQLAPKAAAAGVAPGKATQLARQAEAKPPAAAAAGPGAAGPAAPPTQGSEPSAGERLDAQPAPTTPAETAALARTGTRITLPFQSEMERQFERDFSHLEVYAGAPAAEACAALRAEAFTVGSMIVFASPTPTLETVRHELAHVCQQGGDRGPVAAAGDLAVTEPGGAEEREAEAIEAGDFDPAAAGLAPPEQPTIATKPVKDNFCTTTAEFFLVDKLGGKTLGKLPKGALVKVTAVQSAGYDLVVVSSGALSGTAGYLPDGAIVEAQGIVGRQVFNQGRLGGEVDTTNTRINCLGHASGQRRAAYITNGTTKDMLEGLGFTCQVGDSSVLAPHIKAGKYAMMVYMYMYKDAWREPADQGLSFAELATKYGWSPASWEQPNVYFGPNSEDRPIDYHALNYNAKAKHWEWVANLRERDRPPDYDVDTKGTEPAAANPDAYFGGSGQVLVSIACYK